MKNLLFITIILVIFSCKTNQTIHKKKEGFWREDSSYDSIKLIAKGYYKNGEKTGKWCYFENGKVIKKEKYRQNICYIKDFHKNGKLAAKGQTKIEETKEEIHWFYDGLWQFYDENSKLKEKRFYEKGELIKDSII